MQIIIQVINTIGTSTIEFLCKSKQHWHAREHTRPRATLIDPMCIEESKEDEVKEHHFVEVLTMQKHTKEENVVVQEQLST